jgi:hypothetical protein
MSFRRKQFDEASVHTPPPSGVSSIHWPSPGYGGGSASKDIPSAFKPRDPKEYFIPLQSFTVGLHYYEKDKWVRRDYPGATEIARKHPELLIPADGGE